MGEEYSEGKKISTLWKDFSPPMWAEMDTLLLGWGEMQLKKNKAKLGKWQKSLFLRRTVQAEQRLFLFKMEREDANPRAKEDKSHNGELSPDSITTLQLP